MASVNDSNQQVDQEKFIKNSSLYLNEDQKMEIMWDQLTIKVQPKKQSLLKRIYNKEQPIENKVILNDLKGVARAGKFMGILGPSGSGKTTLLNFLSGRLVSDNLQVSGRLSVNGLEIDSVDVIGDKVAYVMQDDILFPTFTPREAFMFSANLRLKGLTRQEKTDKVEQVIEELGLGKCADTWIGGEFIKGVSGGERKRTSIGVELITNPSVIFLDEPTTGLDSETALNCISVLKHMAKEGRTIISTIHQPSSQIYSTFDELLLLVEGNIIFQGHPSQAILHFSNQGFTCPVNSNPSDFFMKCMVHEGLMTDAMRNQQKMASQIDDQQLLQDTRNQFNQRIAQLTTAYKNSHYFQSQQTQIYSENLQALTQNLNIQKQSLFTQFYYITNRELTNQFRSPLEIKSLIFAHLIFALLTVSVYTDLGEGEVGIQNRRGLILFLSMMIGFSSIQSTLFMFSAQKALFQRETINHTFDAGPFFLGKSLSHIGFQIIYATIYTSIVYYATGMNQTHWYKFPICLGIMNLGYQTGSSYGMLLSVLIPNLEVAMSLVPVLIVPFVLMSGFFVNTNNLPWVFKPLEYFSIFKYIYQANYLNEFQDLPPLHCKAPCNPIEEAGFHETLVENFYILFGITIFFRVLSYIGLRVLSKPEKCKIDNSKLKDQESIQK